MKRKLAAILAADVAGYSKLVADDEEDTLRRLEAYRSVFSDFVGRYGGRIFNTAGDSVLAEFPSSVDAVRCAVDVQESFRTRNLAYASSRHMNFRIGITVGDVVEREGDLLGDGVNIAARLEGIAAPGGICISHAVHEQVANKLSIRFQDIGEQYVKNIPNAIHAYVAALDSGGRERNRPAAFVAMRSKLFVPALVIAGLAVAACFLILLPRSQPTTLTVHSPTTGNEQKIDQSTVQSIKPSRFDGLWAIVLAGGEGCTYHSVEFRMIVVNGRIPRSYPEIGKVDDDGNFKFSSPAKGNPNLTVRFSGKMSGDTGEGSYKVELTECIGSMVLKRTGSAEAGH